MKTYTSLPLVGFLTVLAAPVANAQLETLRYTFDELLTGELADQSIIENTAATEVGDPIDGTVVIPAPTEAGLLSTATIVDDQIIAFDGITFSLGNSLELRPANEADGGILAPHIAANEVVGLFGFAGNADYTAMAWARIDSNVADNIIFGGIGAADRFSLHLGSRIGNYHSGHWQDDLTEGVLTPGEWHHVTFTNEASGAQSIYIDGELASTPQTAPDGRGGRPTQDYDMVIGTSPGTGSFTGGLDQVRVFNSLLTPEEILAAITDGLVPTGSPTLLSGTIVENETLVITINDLVGDTTATVDPGALNLTVSGVAVAIDSASKVGAITTVNYTIPAADLPLPLETLTYEIQGSTVEGATFGFTGLEVVAALPNSFPGEAASSPDLWVVDVYRAEAITAAGFALPSDLTGNAAHQAMVGLIAAGTAPTASLQAPVIAFSDPDTTSANVANKGIFNRDVPFPTDVVDVDDNDIVIYARTQFIVDGPTTQTFSIQADDAYALRVNGAAFTSLTGAAVNFLDATDPSTVYSVGGSNNTNARAVCNFPAAGTYVIELLYREATLNAFLEIGSAEGEFAATAETTSWELVGNPDDVSVPVGGSRFPFPVDQLPAAPEDGSWNTTWYYQGTTPAGALITNIDSALAFLEGLDAEIPSTFSVGPINQNTGFVNFLQGDPEFWCLS